MRRSLTAPGARASWNHVAPRAAMSPVRVGPAGKLLDRALADADIRRADAYVTNAVKHFKNEPRGKRRIHKKPNAAEIEQCHWWLEREIAIVKPALLVALGATAARTLLGRVTRVQA